MKGSSEAGQRTSDKASTTCVGSRTGRRAPATRQRLRSASRATHSVSVEPARPHAGRPTRRLHAPPPRGSSKMPLASSRPPGRTDCASGAARSTSRLAMRLAEQRGQMPGPASASGTLPWLTPRGAAEPVQRGILPRRSRPPAGRCRRPAPNARPEQRRRDRRGCLSRCRHRARCAPSSKPGVCPVLDAGKAQPGRGVQPGAEGHPGSSARTTSSGRRVVLAPRRPDHQPPADAQHREVLLPGLGPVLLVDNARRQLADSRGWRTPADGPGAARARSTAARSAAGSTAEM